MIYFFFTNIFVLLYHSPVLGTSQVLQNILKAEQMNAQSAKPNTFSNKQLASNKDKMLHLFFSSQVHTVHKVHKLIHIDE